MLQVLQATADSCRFVNLGAYLCRCAFLFSLSLSLSLSLCPCGCLCVSPFLSALESVSHCVRACCFHSAVLCTSEVACSPGRPGRPGEHTHKHTLTRCSKNQNTSPKSFVAQGPKLCSTSKCRPSFGLGFWTKVKGRSSESLQLPGCYPPTGTKLRWNSTAWCRIDHSFGPKGGISSESTWKAK